MIIETQVGLTRKTTIQTMTTLMNDDEEDKVLTDESGRRDNEKLNEDSEIPHAYEGIGALEAIVVCRVVGAKPATSLTYESENRHWRLNVNIGRYNSSPPVFCTYTPYS